MNKIHPDVIANQHLVVLLSLRMLIFVNQVKKYHLVIVNMVQDIMFVRKELINYDVKVL